VRLSSVSLIVAVAAGLAIPTSAPAAIYWTNGASSAMCGHGSIGRANTDGTLVDHGFLPGLSVPVGLAVDFEDIVWSDASPCLGTLGIADLDGTNPDPRFITASNIPSGVALDDSYVYWGNLGGGSVGRAAWFGPPVTMGFIPGSGAAGVAVDADHIYWANSGLNGGMSDPDTIGRANLDGSSPEQRFITGAATPLGVAVDASHVYWTNSAARSIGRADLDGGNVDQAFIIGAAAPCGIAVDPQYIYWANRSAGTIGRANLDGSGVDHNFITGAVNPCGIAVDDVRVGASAPVNTSVPGISGTPASGQSLTCSPGTWSGLPEPTISFSWLRDGGPIPGATLATYQVVDADRGHLLVCEVTATNNGGTAAVRTAGVAIAAPAAGPAPAGTQLRLLSVRARYPSVRTRLSCSGPAGTTCRGTIRLSSSVRRRSGAGRRTVSIGTARFTIQAGRERAVTLRANAAGRKLLRSGRALRVTLTVTLARAGAATETVATRRLTLRRPR
jgi:virginiamycin B lyase